MTKTSIALVILGFLAYLLPVTTAQALGWRDMAHNKERPKRWERNGRQLFSSEPQATTPSMALVVAPRIA